MNEAGQIRELSAAELTLQPAPATFGTTAELAPLDVLVGQPRARQALQVGIGIRQPGYHLYVAGGSGTGRMEMVRQMLLERARQEPVPEDWVYVNNFDKADEPIAIALKVGDGAALRDSMTKLIGRLLDDLPKAFQREDFAHERERLRQQYRAQGEALFEQLSQAAAAKGVAVQQMPNGEIAFMPLKDGKPISSEDAEKLPPAELQQIERDQQELLQTAELILQRQQDLERQLNADVRQVERTFADRAITPLLSEVSNRYSGEELHAWLDRLKGHFLMNLDRFRRRADRFVQQVEPLPGEPAPSDLQERFFEYQVNLLVDNSQLKQAPIVIESAPNYRNLFGTVERVVDRYGRVVTNFTRIKAGSLLRANGGYLVFDILDALAEPFVWKELKRTLKRGSEEIEIYDPFAMFTVSGLKPEAIPLNVKLVVLGNPLVYHLLYLHDEEFREIFRVKADFDAEIVPEIVPAELYGRLIRKLSDDEQVRPFHLEAVRELARTGARLAEHRGKLTADFSRICDIIREASFWAGEAGAEIVDSTHVRQTLAARVFRSDLVVAKIRELIREGTLLIDVAGRAIGQINGLAVADLGDYAFGWPARLTAGIGLGMSGVINIERESGLSGETFDKGVLIIEGYLRNTYAREQPLSLTASLAMEQSYGGVEGDSASVAELLCLLSAIGQIPVRQDIAVTGSLNQRGRIQAIGGINEKVEGFFDVCRELGMTGSQGVCLPTANILNLALRPDVIDAVRSGQFHLWPVASVDEAIELLSGNLAGDVRQEESFHGQVMARHREMSDAMKSRLPIPEQKVVRPDAGAPDSPDPRPPLPGR